MIWKFIKTNWFAIAVVVILAAAVVRRGVRITFDGGTNAAPEQRELKGNNQEKFTDTGAWAGGAARTSILPETAQATVTLPAIDNGTAVAYLRRLGNVAVSENKKFGMPASVLLAVSYVNSFAGTRETAQQANNYFTLSCGAGWEGQQATLAGRCVRRYDTAWESFRDFSIHVSGQPWYAQVRQQAGADWRKWVPALAQYNLSDVGQFEAEMTRVIQAYQLFELDAP